MSIKKGDLIQVNLPPVDSMSTAEIQEELFTSLKLLKETDILISVTPPYEHERPTLYQGNAGRGKAFIVNSLILCVDLLHGNKLYKAVPIKYLKRAT